MARLLAPGLSRPVCPAHSICRPVPWTSCPIQYPSPLVSCPFHRFSRPFRHLFPRRPVPSPPVPPPGTPEGTVERAYLATQVSSPFEVFDNPSQLLFSVLLVVLLVLLVAFPAQIFESTFEKNRDEIHGWFRRMPRPSSWNLPSWIHLDILGVVAAILLLMAVVRENFGLNEATLAQLIGYLIGVPLVVIILEMSGELYARRQIRMSVGPWWRRAQWQVLPSALMVALVLALASRFVPFEPPYVYGLIAVYLGTDRALRNLGDRERRQEEGRRTLAGILCLFGVSVIAWLAWTPLDRALDHQTLGGLGWLVLDALLATVFLLGLEAAIFGLIPMTFLKGKDLYQWRPRIWVMIFLFIGYVFVNIQYVVREATEVNSWGVFKAIVLFLAFGVSSVLFWAYFNPGLRRLLRRFIRPDGWRISAGRGRGHQ